MRKFTYSDHENQCHSLVLSGIRNAIRTQLISQGIIGDNAYVVIAGPANTYGHYVTTREEYGIQRYEGASTLYGPCKFNELHRVYKLDSDIFSVTLEAYIDKYSSLVSFLGSNVTSSPTSDAPPAEQTSKALSLRVRIYFSFATIMYLFVVQHRS